MRLSMSLYFLPPGAIPSQPTLTQRQPCVLERAITPIAESPVTGSLPSPLASSPPSECAAAAAAGGGGDAAETADESLPSDDGDAALALSADADGELFGSFGPSDAFLSLASSFASK